MLEFHIHLKQNYEDYLLNIVQMVALQSVERDSDAKQMLIEETQRSFPLCIAEKLMYINWEVRISKWMKENFA